MHKRRPVRTKPPRLPSFYDAVYALVREVPCGQVVAYGWVATWLHSPRAARAVGYALAACPPGAAPWHRVINSAGEISVGGDVTRPERQRIRLAKENIVISSDGRISLKRFGFVPSKRQLARWSSFKAGIDARELNNRSGAVAASKPPFAKERAMAESDAHAPPKAVQRSCERGLKLNDEGHGGKGLVEKTIQWAKHMAAGKPTPALQCRRMTQWFARHKVDKRSGWDNPPTPGFVAWELWGGDAGMRWANTIAKRAEAGQPTKKKTTKKTAKKKAATSKKTGGRKKTSRAASQKSGKKKTKKKTTRATKRSRP